ncbi:MAG: cobyric acid synthase [Synergistaceae bacterium]|nr:cobyric acid synthase [Synergistaceae bacterium]
MLQGTSSSVGKSVLAAALCRIFARRGLKTVPFKSQNMALNSYITPGGEEMGRAQAVQAMAAGAAPSVEMNPVLLKPEGNSRSRVILMGKPWRTLSAADYHSCREELWGAVEQSFEKLAGSSDLVIVEGAGSPAEINLKESEIVNMRVAKSFGCPVLLAGDIDRGGVFAALVGTLALLEEDERALVKGFLINKFRGDVRLLAPGLDMLSGLTGGLPALGVIPWLENLAAVREDSADLEGGPEAAKPGCIDIAVIKFPRISNFDDFDPLALEEGVSVRFAGDAQALGSPDAVILPGSHNLPDDLAWFRSRGLDAAVAALVLSGASVAGVAAGYRMLGRTIKTAPCRELQGLGLLSVGSENCAEGSPLPTAGRTLPGDGFPGEALPVEGISDGVLTHPLPDGARALVALPGGGYDGAVSMGGRVWGSSLNGLFDRPEFRSSWLRSLGHRGGGKSLPAAEARERAFDRLADEVEAALDMKKLEEIIGL